MNKLKYILRIFLILLLFSCLSGAPLDYDSVEYLTEYRELPDVKFIYPGPEGPYMKRLKERLPLDVYDDKSEYEIVLSVKKYVCSLWDHNGWNKPLKSDPIFILDQVAKGQEFRCVEYGLVTVGFLNSLGITARTVSLKTKDAAVRSSGAGHVLSEAYLGDMKKWIMIDSNFDVVPAQNGRPLSLYEFQRAIFNDENLDEFSASYNGGPWTNKEYINWIKPYLYYFDTSIGGDSGKSLMLVPVGAPELTVFQNFFPIRNMLYTHSIADFYQTPEII